MKILPIDIETAPMLSYHFQAKVDYIPHVQNEKSTSILCVSYRDPDSGKIKTISVNPSSARTVRSDRALCAQLHALLLKCAEENIVLLYQNGDRFDLPKIRARFIVHGLPPLPKLITIDTLKEARKVGFDYYRLDYLDRLFGGSGKVGHHEFEMWKNIVSLQSSKTLRKTALREMIRYCEGDILALERVYKRLKRYMDIHPHAGLWSGNKDVCPRCGSHNVTRRTKPQIAKSRLYARFSCNERECGHWFTSSRAIRRSSCSTK